jgi:hypothetical protein
MEDNEVKQEIPSKIKFNYIKSNHFRVVHADGVIGNGTPRNDLFMSFYSERIPLPDVLTYEIDKRGKVGKELLEERDIKSDGIIREMEVGVVVDLDMAKALVVWLASVIQQIEGNKTNSEKEMA